MYNWYSAKLYYKDGDPLCERTMAIIKKLKDRRPAGNTAGINVYNMALNPPVDRGCEFERVPAIIYHGQKMFEARGDETDEELERIISYILDYTSPSNQGI